MGFANRVRNAQSRRHYPRGSPFALDWSREDNILPFVFNLDQMAVTVAWRVDHTLLNHGCVGSSPGIISYFSWVEKAPRFSVPLKKSVARGLTPETNATLARFDELQDVYICCYSSYLLLRISAR